MTTKKCPKCGSKNFQITDYYIRGYIFEVEEGTVHANGENEDAEQMLVNKISNTIMAHRQRLSCI